MFSDLLKLIFKLDILPPIGAAKVLETPTAAAAVNNEILRASFWNQIYQVILANKKINILKEKSGIIIWNIFNYLWNLME